MSFIERQAELRRRMAAAGLSTALITDDDSVYYFSGFYDYLHMEFGRPTILVVKADGDTVLITPIIEADMAEETAAVDRIALWNDGLGEEWRAELPALLAGAGPVAIEPDRMPPVVRNYVASIVDDGRIADISSHIAEIRMVKSAEELRHARHAGEVGMAMMDAGRATIGDGVAEFEVALAISAAGTRKAAELLNTHYDNALMSPNMHFLQIMASGEEITKTHHRATTRIMRRGEPAYICLCGITSFHRFKLGFDRTFWIGEIRDPQQIEIYEVALASQRAALAELRPGVTAETVHAAYADVIRQAGYDYPFRSGRATGYSYLEKPELVFGDKTILQPGMVFAVDGSVCVSKTFRAQVGDSFIITETGYEQITHHPKAVEDMVLS